MNENSGRNAAFARIERHAAFAHKRRFIRSATRAKMWPPSRNGSRAGYTHTRVQPKPEKRVLKEAGPEQWPMGGWHASFSTHLTLPSLGSTKGNICLVNETIGSRVQGMLWDIKYHIVFFSKNDFKPLPHSFQVRYT